MNETTLNAMNEQIRHEFYSAYLYLSMAAYFERSDLPGFAQWMRMQAQEELTHAMRFFDFINERGGKVDLRAIDKPKAEWSSPLAVFQDVLEHERNVSALIHNLYDIALQVKDYPSQTMLHWFIDEQVEEEKSAAEIVGYLEKLGDHLAGLYMLDRQLAERGPAGAQEE